MLTCCRHTCILRKNSSIPFYLQTFNDCMCTWNTHQIMLANYQDLSAHCVPSAVFCVISRSSCRGDSSQLGLFLSLDKGVPYISCHQKGKPTVFIFCAQDNAMFS